MSPATLGASMPMPSSWKFKALFAPARIPPWRCGDFLAAAAQGFGYSTWSDPYPAWAGVAQDPLTDLFLSEGKALGLTLRKNAVHVGLETSILHHLAPELPMVSTGMDVLSPHSPGERVRLDTIAPFVRLLDAVLCHWGQNCTHMA